MSELVSRRSMRNLTRHLHKRMAGTFACHEDPCPHNIAAELVDADDAGSEGRRWSAPRRPKREPVIVPKTPFSRNTTEGHRLRSLRQKAKKGTLTPEQQAALEHLEREKLALGYVSPRELGARAKVTAA